VEATQQFISGLPPGGTLDGGFYNTIHFTHLKFMSIIYYKFFLSQCKLMPMIKYSLLLSVNLSYFQLLSVIVSYLQLSDKPFLAVIGSYCQLFPVIVRYFQLLSDICSYRQLLSVISNYWQLSAVIGCSYLQLLVVMAVSDSYSQLSSYHSVV
jgi:hypothetical protein